MPEEAVTKQLIAFVKKHGGVSILDLGCATGNYSVVLKNTGNDIKGAAVNPKYVRRARERGATSKKMNLLSLHMSILDTVSLIGVKHPLVYKA